MGMTEPDVVPDTVSGDDLVTLTVRLPRALRDSFNEAAASNDTTASQLMRGFARQYVRDWLAGAQGTLPLK
ncbi:MAG: hypothetical protein ACK54X_20400 [Burkholderiales bacterium]|jgi:hypothetical protein